MAVSRPFASSMSRTATNAPMSARRIEMPRPIPEAAPVTSATFPSRETRWAARSSIGRLVVAIYRFPRRFQSEVDVLIRVGQRDNRMQRRRWRSVHAERKQRQHKFLEGGAVHELAEVTVVADRGLVGKHQLKHRTDILHYNRAAFFLE